MWQRILEGFSVIGGESKGGDALWPLNGARWIMFGKMASESLWSNWEERLISKSNPQVIVRMTWNDDETFLLKLSKESDLPQSD